MHDRPQENGEGSKDDAETGANVGHVQNASGGGGSSSYERKVRRAKRAVRSELSVSRGEWRKHGYASAPALLSTEGLVDGLPRVDGSALTPREFAEQYERPRRPCVLTGLCDSWHGARGEWAPDRLLQRLGHCKFKVGGR